MGFDVSKGGENTLVKKSRETSCGKRRNAEKEGFKWLGESSKRT